MTTNHDILTEGQIQKYADDGYLIVDTGISEDIIDGVVNDLEAYWHGEKPVGVSYADQGRIQDVWMINENAKAIATHENILNMLHALYNRQPLPFQTLNFRVGTEQRVHSDSIHFNSEPFGFMCGVWVALEDIGPDQGPLIYYPGSHKLPEMNFQDMDIEPDYANYIEYEDYIENMIENMIKEKRLEPAFGHIKKGQAIIWAANLLHGGSKQHDKSLTRKSQVTHYYFENVKCWRPGYSKDKRAYFEPNWLIKPKSPNQNGPLGVIKRLLGLTKR